MDWSNPADVREYHRRWNAIHRPPKGRIRPQSVSLMEWIDRHLSAPDASGCRVWTLKRDQQGYGVTWTGGRKVRVHRAVWVHANGPTDLIVCHHCDNPPCGELAHLFSGTSADNSRDMAKKGRSLRGAKNPNTKLTPQQVEEIRRLYATGDYTLRNLAPLFGVGKSMVSYIVRGANWNSPIQGLDVTMSLAEPREQE